MKRYLWLLAAMCAPVMPATAKDAALDMAQRFGALDDVNAPRLSPLGNKLVYLGHGLDDSTYVFVADLTAGGVPKAIFQSPVGKIRPSWCAWATEDRLVCSLFGISEQSGSLLGYNRLIVMNAQGGDVKALSVGETMNSLRAVQRGGDIIDWNVEGEPGHILVERDYAPERAIGTRLAQTQDGLGVDDLDVTTMRKKQVEAARHNSSLYISDGHGHVRITSNRRLDPRGYNAGETTYLFRKKDSHTWETLPTRTQGNTDFEPIAIDADKDVVYGFDIVDGYTALVTLSLDGKATRTVVLSRPGVDVDETIGIGLSGRIVGASYATDRREVAFFDPELKALGGALGKALPNTPLISFLDSSADESKLLLLASSDTDPGTLYLFDKKTRHLAKLLTMRPELEGLTLAPMKAISYKAADGTEIPAYLTLPPGRSPHGLPAIVMPHGGPSSRDEWGFDWLVQYFANQGFAVIQPNYRGSAGYGEDWYEKNGFQSWRIAIGDVDDAGRYLVSSGIAAKDKLAIVGWSYGGYAALQGAIMAPDLFKAVIAIAPVTDLEMLREESAEYTNYRDVSKFIGQGDYVREGSPLRNADRLHVPVLLFHGTRDLNVGYQQSKAMADKLHDLGKPVQYVEFQGLSHQLASVSARKALLEDSSTFLRKAMQLPQP